MAGRKYGEIADELRAAISRGDHRPGGLLPSEQQLGRTFGVSRTTVRAALRELAGEGLVVPMQGRGTAVRARPPLRRRMIADLQGDGAKGSPFAAAVRRADREPSWDFETVRMAAPAEVAGRLEIPVGAQVVRTAYVFFADAEPVQTSVSWEPLAVTGGTPIEEPENGPVTGVVARMATIGRRITSVSEQVATRLPTAAEAATLALPRGVPVFAVERTYRVGDQPVESADIVIAGDRYVLGYSGSLTDG